MTTEHETKAKKDHDGKHFKMLTTQPGVRRGEIHPVVFEKGKTYALDESLRDQFQTLDAIEPSHEEPAEPGAHPENPGADAEFGWVEKEPLNEGVLEEDPAALRHAEIPVGEIHARNDAAQANGDMTHATAVALGRAEPDAPIADGPEDAEDAEDNAAEGSKAEAKPSKNRK